MDPCAILPAKMSFIQLDSVVWDNLLCHMEDSEVGSLSQVNHCIYSNINKHTSNQAYWISRIAISADVGRDKIVLPIGITPRELYTEVCTEHRGYGLLWWYFHIGVESHLGDFLCKASMYGIVSLAKLILFCNSELDSNHINSAIMSASETGKVEVVKLLLADSRSDPGADDNELARFLYAYGRPGVLELLAADKRVDASDADRDIEYAYG